MFLNKKIEITIFVVDNTRFEQLGNLDEYTSLMWPDAFNGYAQFQLHAPITENNSGLIKEGNVIWCGGENAAVIEIIKADVDEEGNRSYEVKGRTLEKYLARRIVWGTYSSGKAYASTIMYDMVDKNAINPTNLERKIPYLVNAEDKQIGLKLDQYQKTGGELYEALYNLATDSDIGFSIIFDPRNKRLVFEVRMGVDRTQNNIEGNDPVVFSSDLEDILSSSYYMNAEDVKNVAFVQGEDSGENRKSVVAGDNTKIGFERKELYVDARDLQSEIEVEKDGETVQVVLTEEEYNATLTQRGNEKLSENVKTETFESKIRQFGDIQYQFGVDYEKGDKITVVDWELGISVSARITSVEEDFSDEYSLVLTFGYSFPTLLRRVKRMIG